MSTSSNDTGRALEYSITKTLMDLFDNLGITYSLTDRAIQDNVRDSRYFDALSDKKKESFGLTSKKFIKWIDEEDWIKGAENIILDRLPDKEGRVGNVTDIELKIERDGKIEEKNISVKHNHNALKHPRLPRLPTQCGIKDKKVDTNWRKRHQEIWEKFIENSKDLDKNAKLFRELKSKDNNYIDKNLYQPLIEAVVSFLEERVNNPENCKKFFSFLTNEFDFYTIKDEPDNLVIKKFFNINPPSLFTIKYPYLGRLNTMMMEFDNDWKLTLRLHTASSRMYRADGEINTSTKFDVLCINLDELIEIKRISKK